MSDVSAELEIPDRALFKAAEVCDLVKLQPYVLRSWESEFPGLGVARTAGAARVYRRVDVEQVVRIKNLLLVEGLTLAGARRRLQEETSPLTSDAPLIDELIGRNARERLTAVKRGLRSILELLGRGGPGPVHHVDYDVGLTSPTLSVRPMTVIEAKAARGKATPSGAARSSSAARRKRSA